MIKKEYTIMMCFEHCGVKYMYGFVHNYVGTGQSIHDELIDVAFETFCDLRDAMPTKFNWYYLVSVVFVSVDNEDIFEYYPGKKWRENREEEK